MDNIPTTNFGYDINGLLNAGTILVKYLENLKKRLLGTNKDGELALATILEEINKTYRVLDWISGQHLGLLFNPQEALNEPWNTSVREELFQLEGDHLQPQVEKNYTQSRKIAYMYDTYVESWFKQLDHRIGESEEQEEFSDFFKETWLSDSWLRGIKEEMVAWQSQEVEEILKLVERDKLALANERIMSNRLLMMPSLTRLSEIMLNLRTLERVFFESTHS